MAQGVAAANEQLSRLQAGSPEELADLPRRVAQVLTETLLPPGFRQQIVDAVFANLSRSLAEGTTSEAINLLLTLPQELVALDARLQTLQVRAQRFAPLVQALDEAIATLETAREAARPLAEQLTTVQTKMAALGAEIAAAGTNIDLALPAFAELQQAILQEAQLQEAQLQANAEAQKAQVQANTEAQKAQLQANAEAQKAQLQASLDARDQTIQLLEDQFQRTQAMRGQIIETADQLLLASLGTEEQIAQLTQNVSTLWEDFAAAIDIDTQLQVAGELEQAITARYQLELQQIQDVQQAIAAMQDRAASLRTSIEQALTTSLSPQAQIDALLAQQATLLPQVGVGDTATQLATLEELAQVNMQLIQLGEEFHLLDQVVAAQTKLQALLPALDGLFQIFPYLMSTSFCVVTDPGPGQDSGTMRELL